MSYQEKRNMTNIVVMTLLLAAYCLFAFTRYSITDELRAWAIVMLTFMGIGTLAMIVIQILFHVFFAVGIAVREAIHDERVDDSAIEGVMNVEMIEDERDQLISSKAERISPIINGIGFVIGLVFLILDSPPPVMLNIIFISFFIGSIIEETSKIFYYRRGAAYAR